MKNKNGYLGLAVLAVLVSVLAFAIPTEKTASFWIAYLFTLVAIAGQVYVWHFGNRKSEFLGLSTLYVGSAYLIAQLIVFAVFKAVPILTTWSAVIVCCLILGIAAIVMLSVQSAQTEIERVENKVQTKVLYIRNIQTEVEILTDAETDLETKKELQGLAEKIRFSDPMSSEQLRTLENDIEKEIKNLENSADKIQTIKQIERLLAERNAMCENLK